MTHQNESNVLSAAKLDKSWTLRTTTAAVIHHYSYTKAYVGAGCGCGGLVGLIILYCLCKSS
jgi:hypothetical protein